MSKTCGRKSLQHHVAVGDSASGLADRGGGPSIQKGGLEGVFQLSGDHTPQPPWESLFIPEWRIWPIVEPWNQEEQCGVRPGCGTLNQLYTLRRVLKGSWEFVQPVHMCFVD